MRRTKLVLFIAALACLLLPALSPAATPRAYAKIVGVTQGTFKGEATRVAGANYIPVLRYTYQITSPRDAATGLPSGKRQHMPIVITKTLDAASPQIYQALVTNEVLTQVTIEFMTTSASPAVGVVGEGKELAHYTITLKNATVSDIRQHMDQAEATAAGSSTVPLEPMEDVSFTFQQIQIQSNVGQTSAIDSWSAKE